jgi:hypothetical protein
MRSKPQSQAACCTDGNKGRYDLLLAVFRCTIIADFPTLITYGTRLLE